MRLDRDDTDNARDLRAFALRFEPILPTWIDSTHAFAEVLQALDELMRWREPALAVLLSLAGRLLVTLVDGPPLAGTRDVHPFLYAQVIATPRSHATFPGRLFAVAPMLYAHARAGGLARIDVVSSVAPTHRLEDARAVAAGRPRNTPVLIRHRRMDCRLGVATPFGSRPRQRQALIADEAVIGRLAMHRFIATPAVLHLVLATGSILDRIGLAVHAAHEALGGPGTLGARLTATGDRHSDGTNQHTSQPISIHRFSPHAGGRGRCIRNIGASQRGGKPP
jgi:hypothetical protein